MEFYKRILFFCKIPWKQFGNHNSCKIPWKQFESHNKSHSFVKFHGNNKGATTNQCYDSFVKFHGNNLGATINQCYDSFIKFHGNNLGATTNQCYNEVFLLLIVKFSLYNAVPLSCGHSSGPHKKLYKGTAIYFGIFMEIIGLWFHDYT